MSSAEPQTDMSAYSSYFREYSLLIEYKQLLSYAPKGMYVCPGEGGDVWHGVICLRQGLYKGGVFKFEIGIPADYPETRPSFTFASPVYHPRVDPESGAVDLSAPFPKWRPHQDYMWHILAYIKRLFYKDIAVAADSPVPPGNPEANALYTSDKDGFVFHAKQCVQSSLSLLYIARDGSPLAFSEWKSDVHQPILERVVADPTGGVGMNTAATDDLFRRIASFEWPAVL